MPVSVNGQLAYVPQKFFDDERKAYEQVESVINDFNSKYSESVEVGPLNPVIGWVRPGDLASTEGLERIIALAKEHQPELLHEIMAAHMQRRSSF